MADDRTRRGAGDRRTINTHEDYELRDWAKSLGVTEDEVRSAVAAVGNSADKVRDYLSRHKA